LAKISHDCIFYPLCFKFEKNNVLANQDFFIKPDYF